MISLIWAMDKNNLIGKNNMLPWHYKDDLQYFKKTTLNKTVLMGYNTFQSIISYLGKPLPNRKSIVVTKNNVKKVNEYKFENVEVVSNLFDFLNQGYDEEIFVIGGKAIYEKSIPFADRLYITHIDKEYVGDTYFENVDFSKFKKVSEKVQNELNFCVYERIE